MKDDVKAKWLENLRSGEFEQGVGQLHGADGYCCLGVLCETLKGMGYPLATRPMGQGYIEGTYGYRIEGDPDMNDYMAIAMPNEGMYEMAGIGHNVPEMRLDEEFFGRYPERLSYELDRAYGSDESELDRPVERTLDELNDAGYTFAEISDLIERQL